MKTPDPAHFLTAQQVADELGVSRQTVQRRIQAGELPGVRVGAQYRIPVVQWDAWKAGHWRAPVAPNPLDLVRRRVS